MVQNGSTPARPLPLLLGIVAALAGIGAMLASALVASRLMALVGIRGLLVASESLLILPGLLLVALWGTSLRSTLALGPIPGGRVPLFVALGAALWLGSLGLLELQYTLWPPASDYIEGFRRLHDLLRPTGPFDALVSLLAIAVIPAVCEEALVRGLLLPSLQAGLETRLHRRLTTPLALGLSAAVFALMHDAYRMPFTFAVGLVLGALRLRTGSLWPSLVAHASLNALTFAAAPFLDDPAQPLPDPRPLLGLALVAAGGYATVLLWRRLPEPR